MTDSWYARRSSHRSRWPLPEMVRCTEASGSRISRVPPARNEAATAASLGSRG